MSPNNEKITQAIQLHQAGRFQEAADLYEEILQADPRDWEIRFNLGNALRLMGRLGQAMHAYIETIKHRPNLAEAHCALGIALAEFGRCEEAANPLRRALVLAPALAGGLKAFGVTLKELGRTDEAITCLNRALTFQPEDPDAHVARGECLLREGDWLAGWQDYRHRFGLRHLKFVPRRYQQPMWRGEAGQGRTILIWAEQGLGDAIQFSRFAPVLAQHGWTVLLEVPAEVKRLLTTLPDVTVIASGEPIPPFDVHFPLLDVPGAFGITPDNLSSAAYLTADALAGSWRDRLDALGQGSKIGLVWRGQTTHIRERSRGASAELFRRFTEIAGFSFVSLQRDARPEELSLLGTHVLDAGPGLNDLADTAAMIASLDLVITTDTAVCHLAGSLGVPVWLLLDMGSDWRWLSDRVDSPWYGSMRLFRQSRPGDWSMVGDTVLRALGKAAGVA